MLKSLILIALSLNIAFAKSRFTDSDKQKFMEEVKQEIAAHKVENKGKVDLQIIKPGLYEELDSYYKQEKFTREELVKIKQRYEDFAKNSNDSEKTEEAFYKFVQNQLEDINKTPVAKIKEGQVCNNWSCEDGLKCAPDPKQEDGRSCKKEGRECRDDNDCCSSSCTLDKKKNKRYCEDVYRCFRPLVLGQSCMDNPVCGEGECLAFNSRTSGIGECVEKGKACKKNADCCSNSCNSHKCVESYICKDCMKNGKKPERGQKCCEGLYMNERGMCVPDVPPVVMPQVRAKFIERAVVALSAFFIETAHADEAYDTVNGDHGKYENFKAESAAVDEVKVASPDFKLERKSDFNSCDIRFRDDFFTYLKREKYTADGCEYAVNDGGNYVESAISGSDCSKTVAKADTSLLDMETALLSFDYIFSGDGVNDYWTTSSDPKTSIYGRLKAVSAIHQQIRSATNDKIDKINHKLTCMCLDVKGYNNIKDATKKSFFENECDEFKAIQSGSVCYKEEPCNDEVKKANSCAENGMMRKSCASGEAGCVCEAAVISGTDETAAGVKGKRLLTAWTSNLVAFNESLTVDNTSIQTSLSEVSNWSSGEAKWNDAETKQYTLFNFNIKNSSGSVAAMGAILGALLAAGVIAVLGGFATTSILSAWAAAGIIATSAITGGTGLWLIASLKGAWISKRPEVFDKYIRTYGCGKKETCIEYSRELNQPYNNICQVHTSANACIKNFVVYYQDQEPRYVVDPWIPNGVSKSLILRDASDATDYAHKLEDGFQAAKRLMISKDPGAVGGGGKDGGSYVAENYMSTLFVDSGVLGSYTPKIGLDEKRYILDDNIVSEIKDKAKKYAITARFFEEGDTENLNKFADYTYQYHFLWPKTSRQKEISYPTVGLTTYLDLMSNGVAGKMAVGATNATKNFGNLNAKYLEDYLKTLQLYRDQPINQNDAVKLKLINSEIDKVQADLNSQKTMNALVTNPNLDSQLVNLNASVVGTASKSAGATGDVNLTADQSRFLKAVGTLRVARKAQLKKLDAYNKAIAANGNSDRAIKIASASKSFAASFARPLSGSKGAGSIFGSGGADGLGLKSGSKEDDKKSDSSKNNANYFEGGSYGGGSYGSSSGSRSSHSTNGKSSDSSGDKASGPTTDGMNDDDRRRLAEAIEARDRSNKDKYSSKEDQTIFEKVTNAYIRNYDKVLTKKKDKDVTEQQ
ncbi:MAG: hypothetical protein ACXVCE_03655 [Bacteriovorax sp.]